MEIVKTAVRIVLFALALVVILGVLVLDLLAVLSLRFPIFDGYTCLGIGFVSMGLVYVLERAARSHDADRGFGGVQYEDDMRGYRRVLEELLLTFAWFGAIVVNGLAGLWLAFWLNNSTHNGWSMLIPLGLCFGPLFLLAIYHEEKNFFHFHIEHGEREGDK